MMKANENQNPEQMKPNRNFALSVISARRGKGMTQSELARQVDCKQSAISMLERGNRQALSLEKQEALASVLGLPMPTDHGTPPIRSNPTYCPHYDCPANMPYRVGQRIIALPRNHMSQIGKYCRYCGEICESHCPSCHATFEQGSHCPHCGSPYIAVAEAERNQTEWHHWIISQQNLVTQISQ